PKDAGVLLEAAELERVRDDLGGARRLLREGTKFHPGDARLALALARLEEDAGHPREALAALAGFEQPEALVLRADLLLERGQEKEAIAAAGRLPRASAGPPPWGAYA